MIAPPLEKTNAIMTRHENHPITMNEHRNTNHFSNPDDFRFRPSSLAICAVCVALALVGARAVGVVL